MDVNNLILIAYAVFLAIILIINLLYFFQVFKYRLPGDASLPIFTVYVALILFVIIGTDLLLQAF